MKKIWFNKKINFICLIICGISSFIYTQQEPLDPNTIQKYQHPLVIPPAMPKTGMKFNNEGKYVDYYEIAARQFQQQILPPGMPTTTVWGYGSIKNPLTFNYPAFTIEAKVNKPIMVKWINQLVDGNKNFLPHLLPVDQTLHWANPPAGKYGRDSRGTNPEPYTGPVPIVTHVHGSHANQESDGYPEAWYLPKANNIPAGYAKTGTYFDLYKKISPYGYHWTNGSAVFEYSNDQNASTIWYHDHALGITRLNVYAGLAGFYILRGGPSDKVKTTTGTDAILPNPAPKAKAQPGQKFYEIPIVIQDRSFNTDGSLFYPNSRAFFDGFTGPYIPNSDISPIWNPEFIGNTLVTNGKAWPFLEVEQRRYRFRFLNGCQSRTLILKMDNGMPFWQIGADGGFLPAPIQLSQLLMTLAERADVIIDFTNIPVGTNVVLQNIGPDNIFQGGLPGIDFPSANPNTTGQVMQFRVVPRIGQDMSTPPDQLVLPTITPLPNENNMRMLSFNEECSSVITDTTTGLPLCPRAAMVGTTMFSIDSTTSTFMPMGMPMMWMDPITEIPLLNTTEIWEVYNYTQDAHPLHLHLVQFEVVNREIFDPSRGIPGTITLPEAWEKGPKDTVIAYPGQIVRIKAKFDKAGLYVWHCHVLEHEDNEMMRPYLIAQNLAAQNMDMFNTCTN